MDTGMGIPVTVLRREAVCRIRDGTVLTSTKLEALGCQMQPESASATQLICAGYAPASGAIDSELGYLTATCRPVGLVWSFL
jgi:hypothetical protein